MSAVWLLSAAIRLLLAACLALPTGASRDCCCSRQTADGSGKSCCRTTASESKPLPPCCAKRLAEQRKASGPQVASHHRCNCAKQVAAAVPSVLTRTASAAPSTDAELLATAPVVWLALSAESDAGRFHPEVPIEPDAAPWGAALCLTCCRWNV